jgi:hypothetical protein
LPLAFSGASILGMRLPIRVSAGMNLIFFSATFMA